MKNNPKKRIALFGGSFDPVHTDHLSMALACKEDLKFDEIWMIPTFLSPFKISVNTTNKHRIEMLNIMIEGYDFIKIQEFEINNNKPTPTIETVKHFKSIYPEYDFAFVIGTDNLDRLEEWNNFYELIDLVEFIVFKRSENFKSNIAKKYNFKIYDFKNTFLSSTNIRKLVDIENQDKRINQYINDHLLYLNKRLEPFLDEERYQHCINVGEMAYLLAIKHKVNVHKARIAGTLHDVTKRWPKDRQLEYLNKYNPELIEEPFAVWHSYTGAFHLKYDWLITDQEIINAVFNHTVGSDKMTDLDMVVFCADKISKERNYENVNFFRAECFKDLKNGFKLLLEQQLINATQNKDVNNLGKNIFKTAKKYLKGDKRWN
ncbi:nicotinic acid mononucleotide adenylyltransferase [Entomoplasma ellychniae]|uniref:Probable nicotinate-nucleotide adenylyltransferase n=1 Tax=Entomoplasma ellychniae TaxID=2114 RepID=A0A8E2U9U8_9MOLU|nr:nicotinate-nucleotide adenylyltransferase [Entomoplasma ellychniae]PPE04514.1 nicotinic acid mononucleotide adenylyltransferase [Entomoplasma ellychniae]